MQQFKLAEGNSNRDTVEAIARDYSGLDLGSGAAAAATNAAQTLGRRALEERQFAKTLQNELLKEEMGNRAEMQKALMTGSMERDKMREKAELDYRDTLARNMGISAKAESDREIKAMELDAEGRKAAAADEDAYLAEETEFKAKLAEYTRVAKAYAPGSPEREAAVEAISDLIELRQQATRPGQIKALNKVGVNMAAEGQIGISRGAGMSNGAPPPNTNGNPAPQNKLHE